MALRQTQKTDDLLDVQTLLQTTETSWIRTNVTIDSTSMTAEDDRGPADVAFAIARNNSANGIPDTRVVVIGNSAFLGEKYVNTQGNLDFFINSVNWVQGARAVNTIRPKVVNADTLEITAAISSAWDHLGAGASGLELRRGLPDLDSAEEPLKRYWRTVALGAVLLVLAGAYILIRTHVPIQRAPYIYALGKKTISGISIQNPEATVRFARNDGRWEMVFPASYRVDTRSWRSLRSS